MDKSYLFQCHTKNNLLDSKSIFVNIFFIICRFIHDTLIEAIVIVIAADIAIAADITIVIATT